MSDWVFQSEDKRFGLSLSGPQMGRLQTLCTEAGGKETGGILIGRYSDSHDCAVVTEVMPPPHDSHHAKTRFARGIFGLQERLNLVWKKLRTYYIGEWHFHPDGSPAYSHVDEDQMMSVAADQAYRCPEPILLIIGGNEVHGWKQGAHVFPFGQTPIQLLLHEGAVEPPDFGAATHH